MSQAVRQATPPPSGGRADEIQIDVLQHAAGMALVLAAWVMVFADQGRAAFFALLPGLLILVLTGYNRIRFRPALEKAVVLVGAWTVLTPFLFGFAANDAATWAHVVAGAVTVAVAATRLKIASAS